MTEKTTSTIDALLSKGNGVLTLRGSVWTYAGCPNDPSGTNLVLPTEYASDAEVQTALRDGSLAASVISPAGFVTAVRLSGDEAPVILAGLAGTAEMGTELPVGSRVEHDAGARPVTQEEAERQATDAMKAIGQKPSDQLKHESRPATTKPAR